MGNPRMQLAPPSISATPSANFAVLVLVPYCHPKSDTSAAIIAARAALRTPDAWQQPGTVLQGLGEQKRTKYKINGTATTAIEKSNPNRPAKSRLPYSYQEHEQGEQQRQPRDSHQLPQTGTRQQPGTRTCTRTGIPIYPYEYSCLVRVQYCLTPGTAVPILSPS